MNLQFDRTMAEKYSSPSQIIRILTEGWMGENLYCPHCGNPKIKHFPNNQAVADFYCPNCRYQYELKSKGGKIGNKIADGAYDTFIQRITSRDNPDFFILSYDPQKLCVENLWLVPKHFFIPEIVEKRKPLAETAKRAGWVGCNILFEKIPEQGQIAIVRNGIALEKDGVMSSVQKAEKLRIENLGARGWLMDVLNCVNKIPKETFTLGEIYEFENVLCQNHPKNNNVRPKIRQQLQVLRDRGVLEFMGAGTYRKLS